MNIAGAWSLLWSTKDTATGPLVAFAAGTQQAIWTPRDYSNMAKESYAKNIVAYRCIRILATSAASVRWEVYQGDVKLDQSPMGDLLARPNVMAAQSEFIENLVAYYMISGNAYIEGVTPNLGREPPRELWTLRPDRMRVVPGGSNVPIAYTYSVGGQDTRWDVDPLNNMSPVLHLKTFNPTNDWYGQSPLEAASMSIDIHNDTLAWNKTLVQNDARPPGILTYSPKDGPDILSPEQRAQIIEELEQKYNGKESVKRPLLLEGGLSWQQLGLTPKDMDFIGAKNTTSNDIAQSFGVPPQMVGLPGSQTFANYEQARLAFWEESVIPLLYNFRDEFNNWLAPQFDDGTHLECDLDDVPALVERRRQHFDMIRESDFLTTNEKREALGYKPVDGGDDVLIPATMVPISFDGSAGSAEEEDFPDDETIKLVGGSEYKLFT